MRKTKYLIAAAILAALAMPGIAHADEYENGYESEPEQSWGEEYGWYEEAPETWQETSQEGLEAPNLMFCGVVEDNGRVFTWYSQNVLPGEGLAELNANGRHVGEGGYVMDADGYIAVASPWGQDPIGTVVETPWGLAKVYDVCEGSSYDVYTGW